MRVDKVEEERIIYKKNWCFGSMGAVFGIANLSAQSFILYVFGTDILPKAENIYLAIPLLLTCIEGVASSILVYILLCSTYELYTDLKYYLGVDLFVISCALLSLLLYIIYQVFVRGATGWDGAGYLLFAFAACFDYLLHFGTLYFPLYLFSPVNIPPLTSI